MAVSDNDITDWDIANANNPPSDGTYIGTDLAPQFRNIKSVARAESLAKEFQKTGLTTAGATAGNPALISFSSTDGDLTAVFTPKRKVRLRPSDGSTAFVYTAVVSSAFTTTTSVTLINLFGSVSTSSEYFVDVGTEQPTASPIPLFTQSGTLTFVNTNTALNATFGFTEPNTGYFFKLTPISSDSASAGASVAQTVGKSTNHALVTLVTQPGAGKTVVFGWTLMREP